MNFYELVRKNKLIKSLADLDQELDEVSILDFFKISEISINYNKYCIGDIVFVQKYKYKDGTPGTNHIFLIVDVQNNDENILYYGMLISSKIHKIAFSSNMYIKRDRQNNLNKNSIIKTDVIYEIFTKNILLKIGNIDKTKVEIYKNNLINNMVN